MGTVGLGVKKTIVPRGLRLTANGCNGPLQASLRRGAGNFVSVVKECVKPSFSDTLLI
jgi:hypothetical protein